VGAVLVVVALVAAGCGKDDNKNEAARPTVKVVTPADGAAIKGNVVSLDLSTTGLSIIKADGDTRGTSGHFHVFIDKDPPAAGTVIEKAPGVIHSTEDPLRVPGLSVGRHRLTVVLGDGTHRRIGTASAVVNVDVSGPSVDASAPATIAAGQPLSITATVEGVQLVKADGDTSGRTGHLHAFVDKEPVAGQAIPAGDPMIIHSATSPIVVNALTAGEHTIWVVVGNGVHVPFDPPVADKLTVTVT
jgi:hypothetical protein